MKQISLLRDAALTMVSVRRSAGCPAKPRPGRPARPWLRPQLQVPHPAHADVLPVSVSQEQAAAWTGRSRQTVARWVDQGSIQDVAAARLVALYAHGCPAIPPEALQAPAARHWMRFRFRPDRTQRGEPWSLWTPCSSHGLAWTLVDDLYGSRRRMATIGADLDHWRARAMRAEAEAARLRELVAYQG